MPSCSAAAARRCPASSPSRPAGRRMPRSRPPTPGERAARRPARAGHFAAGDSIKILIAGQARAFTISGITGYGSADSFAGGSLAMFSLPAAQQLFGTGGSYDSIDVKAVAGVPAQQLRDQVARILPPGVTALTAASAAATQESQLNSQLSILTTFFLVFAGVALFVGAFVIWNTFSIMIGQRTRELALLRTLGAGHRPGDNADRHGGARLPGHQGRPGPGAPRCGAQPCGVLGAAAGGGACGDRGRRRAGAGRPVHRCQPGS